MGRCLHTIWSEPRPPRCMRRVWLPLERRQSKVEQSLQGSAQVLGSTAAPLRAAQGRSPSRHASFGTYFHGQGQRKASHLRSRQRRRGLQHFNCAAKETPRPVLETQGTAYVQAGVRKQAVVLSVCQASRTGATESPSAKSTPTACKTKFKIVHNTWSNSKSSHIISQVNKT